MDGEEIMDSNSVEKGPQFTDNQQEINLSAGSENETKKERKERKRLKKLITSIQKQLEFYFGDANLRHDRFLRKEMTSNKNGFVALSVLGRFNKLQQMTGGNLGLVVKAVKNSDLLQLDNDEKHVRRVTEIPELQNTDRQTVYVEHLPPNTDHDWLHEVFSTCGTVEYISLPRFKHNKEIKGFAFIEYSTAEEAEKACRVLNTLYALKDKHKEAKLCGQLMLEPNTGSMPVRKGETCDQDEPGDVVCDIEGSPSKEGAERALRRRRCVSESESNMKPPKKRKRQKTLSESSSDLEHSLCTGDSDQVIQSKRKRKRTVSSNYSDSGEERSLSTPSIPLDERRLVDTMPVKGFDLPKAARKNNTRLESEERETLESSKSTDVSGKTNSKDSSVAIKEDGETAANKKRRKRKKKLKEKLEINIPSLYVIPKSDWVAMKERYKALQKSGVRTIKSTLKAEKNQRGQKTPCTTKEAKETEKKGLQVPLSKGTVLKLTSNDETVTKKAIKQMLPNAQTIAYVDYQDGAKEGFIRFHSPEGAEEALTAPRLETAFSLSQLLGDEESLYFEKVEKDRREKFDRNIVGKRNKERGLDKVKVKKKLVKVGGCPEQENGNVKQHIFFADDE